MRIIHGRYLACKWVVYFSIAVPVAASAQSPSPVNSPAGVTNPDSLEEIIVTAQRRSESAQSVPIAIASFSPGDLQAIGATSSQDLPLMVPGLTLQLSGAINIVQLRGIGGSAAGAQSVLYFVDGAYDPFNYGHIGFNNVASVEVDKGPQGTLFGRNATGGIIQILTKDPSFTPTADVDVGYGNYKTQSGNFYASSGITDKLAADIAVYYNNQKSGWGTNLFNGSPTYLSKDVAFRTKWLFKPFEATTIRFSADYSTSTGSAGTDIQPAEGRGYVYALATGMPFPITGHYNLNSNTEPGWTDRKLGATLRVDQVFNEDVEGSSITAWHSLNTFQNIDFDGTPYNSLNTYTNGSQRAESQEFQLRSVTSTNINWVLGTFFFNKTGSAIADPAEAYGDFAPLVYGTPSPTVPYQVWGSDRSTSYAAFGQTTLTIAPSTRLTLGARYTIDQIYLNGYLAFGGVGQLPGSFATQSVQYQKPTFRLALDHDFTPDVLTYVAFDTGYNSGVLTEEAVGGFGSVKNPPIAPEYIDAYEIGVKTEWLDHRLRVNGAAFVYHYTNLQQLVYEGTGQVTINAGKANVRGIDLDVTTRPFTNLTLSAGAEFLLATYAGYTNGPVYNTAPNGALYTLPGDDSGKLVSGAPRRTANVRADYLIPTSFGNFDSTATAYYTSLQFADPSNYWAQRSYYLLNVSESWTSSNKRMHISLWGKNLNNAMYDVNANMLTPVGPVGNPGAPRTYGVTVGLHY